MADNAACAALEGHDPDGKTFDIDSGGSNCEYFGNARSAVTERKTKMPRAERRALRCLNEAPTLGRIEIFSAS